jgi:hypothetical protein
MCLPWSSLNFFYFHRLPRTIATSHNSPEYGDIGALKVSSTKLRKYVITRK